METVAYSSANPYNGRTSARLTARGGGLPLELAEAIAAVFDLAAERRPSRAQGWPNRKPMFADMEPTHINYPAAARAVSVGVLDVDRGGLFRPTALVNGAEAVDVVRRLERLVRR